MASLSRAHVYFCGRDEWAELALALADAGLAVIPVHLHRAGERWCKDPLIKDWRNRASADATDGRGMVAAVSVRGPGDRACAVWVGDRGRRSPSR